jgi:hypothetical protein
MVNGYNLFNSLPKDVKNITDGSLFRSECVEFVKKLYIKINYLNKL